MKNCTLRALPRWRGFEHEASLRGRPCRDARACMEDSRTAVIVRYAADLNEKGAADLATQKNFIAAWRRSRHRLEDRAAQLRREVKERPHSLHHKRFQFMGRGGRHAAAKRTCRIARGG